MTLKCKLCERRSMECKYVNRSFLEAEKQRWRGKEVPFVSTNDILTSFIMQNRREYGFLAINWRDRVSGIGGDAAGNWFGLLGYWIDESDTPVKIRKSISGTARDKHVWG